MKLNFLNRNKIIERGSGHCLIRVSQFNGKKIVTLNKVTNPLAGTFTLAQKINRSLVKSTGTFRQEIPVRENCPTFYLGKSRGKMSSFLIEFLR
jgi:hypothetical protein